MVVVGAGITGLSLAYWVKEHRPEASVLVLDRAGVAAGASGRNAGFHTAGSVALFAQLAARDGVEEARRFWEFKQESLRLMRERLFSRFAACDFEFNGSATLYRSPEAMGADAAVMASLGIQTRELPTADLEAQGLRGFAGAWVIPEEGACHPVKLLRTLAEDLAARGVVFRMGESVGWMGVDGEGTRLTLERGSAHGKHVFLALNGYLGQLLPGLASWVRPTRAQMLSLHAPKLKLHGNFYDPAHRVYFRRAGDHLLVGGMRLLEEGTENSDFDKTTPIIQGALEHYARETLGLDMPVTARWSGVMGFTPGEVPYARAVPDLPHVTFVGGYSGHGMGAAFGTAHAAVRLWLGLASESARVLSC